ncbi:MAG: hypothetical protein OSA81_10645 [Longimicrobiales bacterium]|nr:hypothetical protein [Longimicrobiales bacterium]
MNRGGGMATVFLVEDLKHHSNVAADDQRFADAPAWRTGRGGDERVDWRPVFLPDPG